jgi:prefoldin subunit 5
VRLRGVLLVMIIVILAISSIAHANEAVRGYFVVNYVTYLNPSGQATNYYIEYSLTLYNNEPYPIPLTISIELPQYSSVIYTSPTANVTSNEVTWIVNLQPYSEETLEVRFKPIYTVLPIASLDYQVLVNGTPVNTTIINGGVGTRINLLTNITNLLPFPTMTTISLTRQSGLYYEYNITPTITQNVLGYEVDYWLFSTSNNTSFGLGMVVEDLGPWHSIRVNPVGVQVSIDLNQSINSLRGAIDELNATINQLSALSSSVINASSTANNYTAQFLQLIALLNQTSNVLGASAYLINSTLLVESLLQAQLIELKIALTAGGQVLGTEANVISQLRSSLNPIVGNEQSYINALNTLKNDLSQIEKFTNNSTLDAEINNTINAINQVENLIIMLNQVYNNLGEIQSEISSTQAQVNQAVEGLNYAIYAANESEALIISISKSLYLLHNELSNLTNQLLSTYLGVASYQARAMSYLMQIGNYEGELRGMMLEDEVRISVLNALANQYLGYLRINNTDVSIDITIEETFIVEMPSIVNTQYLLQLLNETAVQGNKTTSHGVSMVTAIPNHLIYLVVLGVLIAVLLITFIIRKLH